eukprot:13660796-Alexandrium_andersonii.AAC.1
MAPISGRLCGGSKRGSVEGVHPSPWGQSGTMAPTARRHNPICTDLTSILMRARALKQRD